MSCSLGIINKCMKYMFYPLAILLLVLAFLEFVPVLVYACGHIAVYQWMLYGVAAYFIVRRFEFFSCNELWMQTISHEASHAIVGMMFFHKIHSLQANEDSGVVYHSGRKIGEIFISLAPYCLPILTYLILIMRIMGANKMLYVFDLFIGFTLAFHIMCFYRQTRLYQTDIQNQGYIRAFLFIFTAWFFNATIILLSIRKGLIGAIAYIFPEYWDRIADWCNLIF